jgi:hypothetical protein
MTSRYLPSGFLVTLPMLFYFIISAFLNGHKLELAILSFFYDQNAIPAYLPCSTCPCYLMKKFENYEYCTSINIKTVI